MKNDELKKEFLVPSDLKQVRKASSSVLSFLKPLALSEAVNFDIRLCLEEALVNAMKYGNCLKKDRSVRLGVEGSHRQVCITVEDQGKGFDPKKIKDCTQKQNLLKNCGRGVFLIKNLMDKVQYNAKGNKLCMVKKVQSLGK